MGIVLTFIIYGAFLVSEDEAFSKVSVSDILNYTRQEKRLPNGILIHPKRQCSTRCSQKTVITVISRTSHKDRRKVIRQTWGHLNMQRKYNFCLYFVVGTEDNIDIRDETNDGLGDIVQVNVSENYFRLTDKVFETFNWITNFCREPRLFFKIDDDVYFDLDFLYELQDESYPPDNILIGNCKQSTPVTREVSKYFTTFEEYPFDTYPPYCGGPGYLMTVNTAHKVFEEMLYTKKFKLEDAYIGLVLYRLGLNVRNIDNFIYALDKLDGYMQFFWIRCHRITHGLTSSNIQQLWERKSKDVPHNCLFWSRILYKLQYLTSFIIDQGHDFTIST